MFVRRAVFEPKLGKLPALSELLVALNMPENPIVVSRRLFGGAQLVMRQNYPDLAAYEAWIERFTPNPAIVDLCDAVSTTLWEVREPAPAPANGATGKFIVRVTYHAAHVAARRDLLRAVEERVAAINAAGGANGVWLNVAGDIGAVAMTRVYPSMAEVERARSTTMAASGNDDALAFMQRIAPLVSPSTDGANLELLQILTSRATRRAEPAVAAGTRA